MINRQGFYVTDTERECTKCGDVFKITSRMTLCGPCNSKRVKSWNTSEYKLWQRARDRSKKSGTDFEISPDDIVIPERCPYLDLPLRVHSGTPGGRPDSPALDRVDNTKGYTKDNIEVISHLANMMKSSASKEQLVSFARHVLETFGED